MVIARSEELLRSTSREVRSSDIGKLYLYGEKRGRYRVNVRTKKLR